MLDWSDLQSFLAIARHGSLSGAARVLGVRQSTMGRRLAALEARIGQPLFARTPAGFVTTAAGEAILGNAERIEHEALAAERRITGKDVRLEGLIRLTTVETLAAEILAPILAAFQERHPGITLEVIADTRSLSLSRREADVALRLARPTPNDLAARKVGEIAWGVYAAHAYLDRHGMPDFASGAAGHRVILNAPDLMNVPELAWLASITSQATVALRTNSRYIQRAAAEAGFGIACLARYLADGRRDLAELPVPGGMPSPRELWLTVHQDTRHTPKLRALTDFLAEALKPVSTRLAPPRRAIDGPSSGAVSPLSAATAP
jgi:DNA-binding transcriptional LysR family regulator